MSGWQGGILGAIGFDPDAPPPPAGAGLLGLGPVGRSTVDMVSNPDPSFSPLASRERMTPQAAVGALMMGKRKPTVAELPAAEERAETLVDAGMAVAGATNPIRAFHGTPHSFDRFDLSKIGTGEGAQAYGHGLYFAGDEAVARSYRDALSEKEILRQLHMTVMNGERGSPAVQAAMAKIDEIVSRPKDAPPLGSMYEVALHTEPGRLLDWDKRLHQQPEAVRKAVDKVLPRSPGGQNLDMTGAEVWRRASEMDMPGWKNSREGAASMLRELGGLDGIQYLDAGSRGAGQGTRNYVINNADLIEILRQYGIIGAVGGGAAAAAGQGERAD